MHYLLERDHERDLMRAAIESAATGEGKIVFIEGPAGIGKSALLDDARTTASASGVQTLTAQCSDLESSLAFGAVRRLFGEVSSSAGGTAAGAPNPSALLIRRELSTSNDDESFAILHGLYWLIVDLSAEGPLAIFVDDLQWCDLPSLRFINHLASRVDELPVVLFGSVRTGEIDSAAQPLLDRVMALPNASILRPAPLSEAACEKLVKRYAGDAARRELSHAFWSVTAGNPLLVRELAVAAVEENVLATEPAGQSLAELAPRAIGRRVAVQLKRLGDSATRVSEAVSVFGEVDASLAAQITGLGEDEVSMVADRLIATNILEHSSSLLRFVHPLVRSAVYANIPPHERARLHVSAARAMLDRGEDVERAASHLLQAPTTINTALIKALREAAAEAVRRGDPGSAIRFLERALEAPLPVDERRSVLAQIGPLYVHADPGRAETVLREALRATRTPAEWAAIAADLLRAELFLGRHDAVAAIIETAARQIGVGHTDAHHLLLASAGVASLHDPSTRDLIDRYAIAARNIDTTPGIGGRALDSFLAMLDTLRGTNPEDALERARRALSGGILGERTNFGEAWGVSCIVLMSRALGEVASHVDVAVTKARETGSAITMALAVMVRGLSLLWRGELIAAEADLEDALHFADSAGLQHTRPAVGWLAESLTDQGRYERAAAALNETWPEEQVPELGAWWFFLLARGRLALGRGRWSEAARDLQACGERYEAHGWRNPAIVPWRRLLAEALHEMGDYGAARSLTEVELELAREWGDDRSIANALRTLAVSYRGDKQLELLEESVALLASTSARLDYARSLVASGQARARAGDQPGSGQLLTEGLHVASVCGATPLAQVALQELRKLGFRPRRTFTSGLASLTAQEHRVAQLAASGLSNRQIAEQTYVTLKTVETHIASVLRKLSISSRRDIAERLQQSSELN